MLGNFFSFSTWGQCCILSREVPPSPFRERSPEYLGFHENEIGNVGCEFILASEREAVFQALDMMS